MKLLQLGVGCPAERGLVGMWVGKGHGSLVTEVRPLTWKATGMVALDTSARDEVALIIYTYVSAGVFPELTTDLSK